MRYGRTAGPGVGWPAGVLYLASCASEHRRQMAEATAATQFETLASAAQGCAGIVAATALQVAARSVAEKSGISYVFAAYAPVVLPSLHRAPPPIDARRADWRTLPIDPICGFGTRRPAPAGSCVGRRLQMWERCEESQSKRGIITRTGARRFRTLPQTSGRLRLG